MKLARRTALKMGAAAPLALAGLAHPAQAGERVPLLFDTDIGTDIDDALTVAYLLKQSRCDLLGVTTCYGDTLARAKLVSAICAHADRGVPIHPGSAKLMNGKTVEGKVPQAAVLPDWPHRDDFEPDSAAEFLYQTIKSRPGEITLLAVGPLTNVARLFQEHPDSPMLLKRLTLMNGSFRLFLREYNAACDSEAARIVYETRVPELIAVDFETSLQCRMGAAEARKKIQGGILDPAAAMLEVWLRAAPAVIFYDTLAASSIFEPGLLAFQKARVVSHYGFTIPRKDPKGPHLISTDVDQERFKAHFFSTVS